MAKSNSTTEQLDIAKNLLAVTQQMAAAVDAVNKKQMDQVQIMTQIQDAMKALDTKALITSVDAATKAINDLTAKLGNLGKTSQQTLGDMSNQAKQAGTSVTAMATAVNQAGNAASNTSNSVAKLATAVQDNNKKTEKAIETWEDLTKMLKERFPKSAIFASGALSGLTSGFGAVGAGIGFAIDAFKNVVDAILEIGKAIIALPFDFLDFLTEKANKLASGSSEWFAAVQEVKKAYGDLQQTASSALISMAKNNESLEGTGLNARRMWGSAGAQLKAFLEMSVGLGATFDSFADEFKKTGKQLPSFMKGLGLTGEEFRSLTMQAKITGQSVTSVAVSFTKQSLALSKQFGVSAKLISKDMAKALGDVKHFGGATVKQIASASVYARKLGLELEKITGTLDAFETFESAADNASKLSQAFGVNIDAFKMMEAQDPATQLDMLRKSFAAAGKDASSFNRQQLSLLASATGLDEAAAKQAFSLKNQGVSLDKINKKSDEAEKRQIDQIKALRELKGAMDLVAQSGSSEGGFLDKFLQGVTQGFERTSEFRGLMRNMIGTFHVLRQAGRELGEAIMKTFPGMKMFFEGLKEIFDPKKFSQLAGGIVDELKKFFKEFMSGKYSFKQLMENITGPGGVFDKFMGAQGSAGSKVVEGFKTMWRFVTKLAAEAIGWLSEKIGNGIRYIGRLISGKEKLTDGGAGSFLSETLGPIWEALKDAWKNISPVLLEMLESVGDKIWNWASTKLIPMLEDIAPYVIGAIFGGAALKGLLSLAVAGFGKLLASQLAAVIGKVGATVQGAAAGAGTAAADAAKSAAAAVPSPSADMAKKLAGEADAMDDAISKQRKVLEAAEKDRDNFLNSSGAKGKSKLAGKDVDLITSKTSAVGDAKAKLAELEGKKSVMDQLKQAAPAAPTDAVGKVEELKKGGDSLVESDKKSKWGGQDAARLGLKLLAIVAVLAVGGIALVYAVKHMAKVLSEVPTPSLIAALATLTVTVLLTVPLMAALKMAEGQDPGKMAKAAGVMALALLAMGAVAVGLVYLAKQTGAADWNAIGQVLAVMAGLVLLSIPLLAAMWLAAKIDPISVGLGALVIALGVAAMAYTAFKVVDSMKGMNTQDVDNATKMLDSISSAFLMMVPILLGAGVIGAIIIGSLGIGAGVMVTGMKAMADGVMHVAETAVDILKKLKEANLDSSVGPAIDSFLKVMEVVVKMFDSIGGMFETLMDVDFKKGETASSRLDAGGRFISSLIGAAGSGTGIIGIAETLLNAARSVKTEDLGPSAEVFTNLLASIPGILTGLRPSDAFYKACDELGGDSDEIDAMVKGANDATDNVTKNMGILITKLKFAITDILELDLPDPEKAKGVGAILSGIGGVLQSLMPDPDLIEKLRDVDGDESKIDWDKLGQFLKVYLKQMETTLPELTGGIISRIIGSIKELSPDQISKLGAMGEILGAIGGVIGALSNAQKSAPQEFVYLRNGKGGGQWSAKTASMAKVLEGFKDLPGMLDGMLDTLKTMTSKMPTGVSGDTFEKQIKIVASLFSLLKSIPELAAAVKELDTVPGAKDGPPTSVKFDIAGAIGRVQEILTQLKPEGDLLTKLMGSITSIYGFLTKNKGGSTMAKAAELVTAFFGNLQKLSESFKSLSGSGGEAAGGPAQLDYSAIESEVGQGTGINTISSALGNLEQTLKDSAGPLVGISSSLQTINGSMGRFDASKVTGTIVTFVNALSGLGEAFDGVISAPIPDAATVSGKFTKIGEALGSLAGAFGKPLPGAAVGPVPTVNLSQVQTALANVDTRTLGSIAKNFSGLTSILSSIETSFEQVKGVIDTKGLTTSMDALIAVIDKVNDLDGQLTGINAGKVSIKAGLRTLAGTMGIGGSASEIKLANRDVVINLSIQVDMKADEVEKAIVLRKDSVIRDRLNFSTQNPGLTGAQGILPGVMPKGRLAASDGGARKTGEGN